MSCRTYLAVVVLLSLAVGCKDEPAKPAAPAGSGGSSAAPAMPRVDMSAVAADVKAQAQTLIDQATAYIKDDKLDLAEKAVTQLESLKSKLPGDYQAKVDEVVKMLKAAKAAVGTGGAPALPK